MKGQGGGTEGEGPWIWERWMFMDLEQIKEENGACIWGDRGDKGCFATLEQDPINLKEKLACVWRTRGKMCCYCCFRGARPCWSILTLIVCMDIKVN